MAIYENRRAGSSAHHAPILRERGAGGNEVRKLGLSGGRPGNHHASRRTCRPRARAKKAPAASPPSWPASPLTACPPPASLVISARLSSTSPRSSSRRRFHSSEALEIGGARMCVAGRGEMAWRPSCAHGERNCRRRRHNGPTHVSSLLSMACYTMASFSGMQLIIEARYALAGVTYQLCRKLKLNLRFILSSRVIFAARGARM